MTQYMTIPEASHRWNIEPEELRNCCRRGEVPNARMVGTIWLIPCDARLTIDKHRHHPS